MAKPLNALEREVLDYLVEYVRHHTYQPSIREIGREFEIKSTKTVSELLQSLADKGWIERSSSRSRGVRLLGLELAADVVSVPHVALGAGDPSLEDPLDTLTVDRRIAATAGCFFASMEGDGMREEGIRDGDLLLIEPVPVPELHDGDLVLCRLPDVPTVWRFGRQEGQVVLEAGLTGRPPLVLERESHDRILGRIGAVVRRLRTDAPMGRAPQPAEEEVLAP